MIKIKKYNKINKPNFRFSISKKNPTFNFFSLFFDSKKSKKFWITNKLLNLILTSIYTFNQSNQVLKFSQKCPKIKISNDETQKNLKIEININKFYFFACIKLSF